MSPLMYVSPKNARISTDSTWRKDTSAPRPQAIEEPQDIMVSSPQVGSNGRQHLLDARERRTNSTKDNSPVVFTVYCAPRASGPGRVQEPERCCRVAVKLRGESTQSDHGISTARRPVLHVMVFVTAFCYLQHVQRPETSKGGRCSVCSPESQAPYSFTLAVCAPVKSELKLDVRSEERRTATQFVHEEKEDEKSGVPGVADASQALPTLPPREGPLRSVINEEREQSSDTQKQPVHRRRRRRKKRRDTFYPYAPGVKVIQVPSFIYEIRTTDRSLEKPMRSLPPFRLVRDPQWKGEYPPSENPARTLGASHKVNARRVRQGIKQRIRGRVQTPLLILGIFSICFGATLAAGGLIYMNAAQRIAQVSKKQLGERVALRMFAGSGRLRMLVVSIAAGVLGHVVLRRLAVVLITFCYIGALMGALVLYATQAFVDRVIPP